MVIIYVLVASFTDAWIETQNTDTYLIYATVASFTDAWIETTRMEYALTIDAGRIFYRCVD